MTYFIRNVDLKVVGAIIFVATVGVMGWMEMNDGGSVLNAVSPIMANCVTSAFQLLISTISAI